MVHRGQELLVTNYYPCHGMFSRNRRLLRCWMSVSDGRGTGNLASGTAYPRLEAPSAGEPCVANCLKATETIILLQSDCTAYWQQFLDDHWQLRLLYNGFKLYSKLVFPQACGRAYILTDNTDEIGAVSYIRCRTCWLGRLTALKESTTEQFGL